MKKIKLLYPFEANGTPLAEITLERHATVQDLITAGGDLSEDDVYFKATGNIAGIAPDDFDNIDHEDFLAVKEALDELAEENPSDISHINLRRPTGREVIDFKKDMSAPSLVKAIAKLAGVPEKEILGLNTIQFSDLVSQLGNFLGRRKRK